MAGLTQRGPYNKPTLIMSFPEFQLIFGGYLDEGYGGYRYLPHAVEGFFQNGGQRVYVNRVAASEDNETRRGSAGENNCALRVSDQNIIGEDSGEARRRTGLRALSNVADIKIIAIPNGTSQKIQDAMIEHCEQMRNRFAVLDPRKCATLDEIQGQRSLYDSRNAALYYPWIRIRDPATGEILSIPPSGHICGIYARNDAQRGAHKAPANEAIEGVLGPDLQISKAQQAILNPRGINCLRELSGRGLHVMGARTTSNDPLWKYINVRRLFLFLEESIERGTQWVVFEQNNEKLWARVKQTVSQFLTRVWRDGALMGNTPEQAFFVKCDHTTMTREDVDKGRLIVLIGFAPLKQSEFVIFRISQLAGGSARTQRYSGSGNSKRRRKSDCGNKKFFLSFNNRESKIHIFHIASTKLSPFQPLICSLNPSFSIHISVSQFSIPTSAT